MFGLEDNKKGPKKQGSEEELLDFEKDMKNATKREKTKQHTHKKMHMIKTALREGDMKEEFDQLGVLLHGYAALINVIDKTPKK
ncbi:MAG: needle chaperone SctE [Waddliaceae bacterium]|nr:needle chaperone SctE [Waddliaceae bacterium]